VLIYNRFLINRHKYGDIIFRNKTEVYENQKEFDNETFATLQLRVTNLPDNYHRGIEQSLINYNSHFRVLDDDFKWYYASWFVTYYNVLYEPMEKFIGQCREHGILDYMRRRHFPAPVKLDNDRGPKVLTMQVLSAGFIVWICCVAVSIVIFVLEHLTFQLGIHN
jgi:hypothetical protein